jgi:hypothetical protein
MNTLKDFKIDSDQIKKRLVGYTADGANNMSGEITGLNALIRSSTD